MKGWHLKLNKNKVDLEASKSNKSSFDFVQKTEVEVIDSVTALIVEHEQELIQLESVEKRGLAPIINAEKEVIDNNLVQKSIESNDAFFDLTNETILEQRNAKNLKTMPASYLEIKEMERYHLFNREPLFYIKMFGLFLLILVLTGILLIGGIFIALELSGVVGVITIIIGVFFIASLQDFLRVRILNESWGDQWTFGDSMIRIGILFGALALIGLLVYVVGIWFDL